MPVLWMLSLTVILHSALLYALPVLSRQDVFFSVTVPAAFRRNLVARRTLASYRTAVVFGSALAIGVMMAVRSPRLQILGLLLQSVVAASAWAWARSRVRPHAAAQPTTRVASLVSRPWGFPGGWPVAAGPFVIMSGSALLLVLNWGLIPEAFPYHWNAVGLPDRWTTKSVRSVFGPLLMGGVILSLTFLQTWWLLTRTKQVAATGQAAESEWRFKRTQARLGVAAMYTMAVLFSYLGTRSLFAFDFRLGLGFWLLMGFIVLMSIGTTVWMVRVGQGGQRDVPDSERTAAGDATPDSAWKAGLIYFNPSDPAVFVEKRMGLGWTLNFGNRWAWVFTAALFLPLAIVLLLR